MQLISKEDVAKLIKLNKFPGILIARFIIWILQLNRINKLYSDNYNKPPLEFLSSVLKDAGIKYDIEFGNLGAIPEEGPFIIVANHPFGAIEGLILMESVIKVRSDFKLIANFLLQRIEPIKDIVLAVNPFETYRDRMSSYNGLKAGLNHLKNGHPLGIFPAGEVSSWQKEEGGIADRQWQKAVIKLIKMSKVPVIPVYFKGKNSRIFYILGTIHPLLRTVKLPSEVLNKRNVKVNMIVGEPISVEDQDNIEDINKYSRMLRTKTYALSAIAEQKDNIAKNINIQAIISHPVDKALLAKEISLIEPSHILFKWQDYSVYCVPTVLIPDITREIGRLREITFREVGEGTNQSSDTDEFDSFYHQLFIWNEIDQEIIGGYRLGKGFDIIKDRGIKGFYINTLFRIDNAMEPILNKSIELGRSFVIKKYQRKPWSLYLLWKGILHFLNNNSHYRYLIGPLSISNNYSQASKHVMVEFIKKKYFNSQLTNFFIPQNPYLYKNGSPKMKSLVNKATDLNSLDNVIKEIEPSETKMPVLLRKYILLGGKIASFNIDPEFNNCLDCLLILDLEDVPGKIIQLLSKEQGVS